MLKRINGGQIKKGDKGKEIKNLIYKDYNEDHKF